jgi:transposase-like protein
MAGGAPTWQATIRGGDGRGAARRLIEGRLRTASAKDELVKLAARLIVEEALEGEAGVAVGRDYYEHGAQPGQGYRNGYPDGTAEDGRRSDGIFGAADRGAG